ncbi:hypothetical protein Bhyg_13152, partial [Pseudolycoriella hygida]
MSELHYLKENTSMILKKQQLDSDLTCKAKEKVNQDNANTPRDDNLKYQICNETFVANDILHSIITNQINERE